MSLISRGNIQKQLRPGLNKVFGMAYKNVDNEHTPIFIMETSDKNFEEEVMMTGFESAPVKPEGSGIFFDEAQETFTARYVHETIALGFAITEEAMEDNLYESKSKMQASALGRAMGNTKQLKAAAILNNGFNSANTGGDGVSLFSTAHPTKSAGNQSNTGGAVDLSETALETALIAITQFKDERGILIGANAQKLIIPSALTFTAQKILKSELSTTIKGPAASPAGGAAGDGVTNANDLNIVRTGSYVPGGWHINRRLTDTNAWFLITDVPNGLKGFTRTALKSATEGHFETGNVRFKARERYSFGWSDFRGAYGSSGST